MVTLCLLFVLGFPVWAEDEPTLDDPTLNGTEPVQGTFSIGVNNFPWLASSMSLRWWKNENVGREFMIGTIGLEVSAQADTYEGSTSSEFSISRLRYDWLHREKTDLMDNLYYIWGNGIGLVYDTEKTDILSNLEVDLIYYHPLGFEQFFWDKYPNLSYSIQADFYAGVSYFSRSTSYNSGYETSTSFSVGVQPRFFLRYYIK